VLLLKLDLLIPLFLPSALNPLPFQMCRLQSRDLPFKAVIQTFFPMGYFDRARRTLISPFLLEIGLFSFFDFVYLLIRYPFGSDARLFEFSLIECKSESA